MKSLLVFLALAGSGSSIAHAQTECALYAAALSASHARPDSMLVIDRLTMGIPVFALEGYVGVRSGDTLLADSGGRRLAQLNQPRKPLPKCITAELKYRTIDDSTVFARFGRNGEGWKGWTGVKGFAIVSEPVMSADSLTALIYVGTATGPLSGEGTIYRFRKDEHGVWIKEAEVNTWIS
jgi:hypothetical protein